LQPGFSAFFSLGIEILPLCPQAGPLFGGSGEVDAAVNTITERCRLSGWRASMNLY